MNDGLLTSLGALALPLGAGLVLGLLPVRAEQARRVGLIILAVATASLAATLWLAAPGVIWAAHWLPDMGALTLELGKSGLQAALATTAGGLVALALVEAPRRWVLATGLMCLGAANVAFLSGHFLGRYVALEVVALCVAVVPLIERSERDGPRIARAVYMLLRLGDAGLLMAILLLWRVTGTLDIDAALAGAQGGDPGLIRWVAAGFVLAVWLKMGAWPLQAWIEAAERLSPFARSWTFATVLPNLGFYLLYRVTPLLAARDATAQWLGWGGSLAALVAGVGALVLVRQGAWRRSLAYLGGAQAGLALVLAASGEGAIVLQMLLLVTPPRLALYCAEAIRGRQGSRTSAGIAGVVLALVWLPALWTMRVTAPAWAALGYGAVLLMLGWTAVAVAFSGVSVSWGRMCPRLRGAGEGVLGAIAVAAYRWVEQGLLGGLLAGLAEGVLWTSRTTHTLVEQGALDGSMRLAVRTARGLSLRLQRWHTGKLRTNLLWGVLSFGAMMAWAVWG